jgi:uncharacterized membrane protein
MTHSESKIDVDVPVRTAYDQWTQFESFPAFMKGVKSVRQLADNQLQWVAEIGGRDVEWTAEITHQEPDRHIGWRSTSGAHNAGSVKFEPLGADRTRVVVRLDYTPEGAVEKAGSALGVVSHRIEADLGKFKDFVEARGGSTGAWRGTIREGRVEAGGEGRGLAEGGDAAAGT